MMDDSNAASGPLRRPGFGLRVDEFAPRDMFESEREPLDVPKSRAFDTFFNRLAPWLTMLELRMLAIMNSITDKDGWREKVYDQEMVSKWRKEANQTMPGGMPEKAFDQIFQELRHKARQHVDTGMVTVYDAASCVVKSDTIVPNSFRLRLLDTVKVLEEVPDHAKDWHGSSRSRILALAHPSLYPLVYGRSRILPNREIDREDCLDAIGEGKVVPRLEPSRKSDQRDSGSEGDNRNDSNSRDAAFDYDSIEDLMDEWDLRWKQWPDPYVFEGIVPFRYSAHCQWLPCEVRRSSDDGPVQVTSYINNLHPRHTGLYGLVEDLIAKSIPLWDQVLHHTSDGASYQHLRVRRWNDACGHTSDTDDVLLDGKCVCQELRDFNPPEKPSRQLERDTGLSFASHPRLQVIVKFSNILLTPSKPRYEGSRWDIEGHLNERIVATAVYCYGADNVTSTRIALSHSHHHKPNDQPSIRLSGYYERQARLQGLGSVLMRPGRLVAFPNLQLHRMEPFQLAVGQQPGHYKVITLCLVDPHTPILSTANVPPQRKDW